MERMISVVIPVYNCEQYLRKSIGSLLSQTIINELELFCVDDGSTDGSYQLLREYEKKYRNIRVSCQNHQGVSHARNKGLKEAKGEYIAFFDADDYAEPQLYERLYSLATENNADISIVDYSMVFPDGIRKKHRSAKQCAWIGQEDLLRRFFASNDICPNPVDKLFKRETIEGLTFPEGFAIGEDMYFVYQTMRRAKKVVLDSRESLYRYQIREGSAMTSEFSDKYLDPVRLSKRIMRDEDIPQTIWDYAEANYIHEICKMMRLLYKSDRTIDQTDEIKEYLQDFKNYSLIKGCHYMSSKHWSASCLMKLSPKIYSIVYSKLRIG